MPLTPNMAMTEGPEQTDSPHQGPWILKRISMIQRALIVPAQLRYSHLPLEIKKNWTAFCRSF